MLGPSLPVRGDSTVRWELVPREKQGPAGFEVLALDHAITKAFSHFAWSEAGLQSEMPEIVNRSGKRHL